MEKTRVIISGIGEYQPPWKLDNQYLFDKYISLVDQRLFIRNAIEILRGGFLAKKQTEAIRVLESDRGFGIKSRYWEVLPEDDDFQFPTIRASNRSRNSSDTQKIHASQKGGPTSQSS